MHLKKVGESVTKVFFILFFSSGGNGIDRFNMRVCAKTLKTRSESSA